jgi:hypothetical protein
VVFAAPTKLTGWPPGCDWPITWSQAGKTGVRLQHLAASLQPAGTMFRNVPLTDLVIAALAQRIESFVFSTDPHFDLVPQLKKYRPS